MLSKQLGYVIFLVWQVLVLATSLGQLFGFAQALEWGETPTGFAPGTWNLEYIPVDFLIEIGALLEINEDTARMRFQRALPKLARLVRLLHNGELSVALEEAVDDDEGASD